MEMMPILSSAENDVRACTRFTSSWMDFALCTVLVCEPNNNPLDPLDFFMCLSELLYARRPTPACCARGNRRLDEDAREEQPAEERDWQTELRGPQLGD